MLRLAIVAVVIFFSCSASVPVEPKPEPTVKILFVGNSLTYANNLPSMVVSLAQQDGQTWYADMLALPNYALEDHWMDGDMQNRISTGGFDFVVVQQGPSSQADGRAMLLEYGQKISQLCNQVNARLAFYMVWPARANYYNFDGVIRNYTEAATQTNSILIPVGKVWKEYFDTTQDFSYYDTDMFHPSIKGSEVAARMIYEELKKNAKK